MSTPAVLYLANYKIEEEKVMRDAGLVTFRGYQCLEKTTQNLAHSCTLFVRGPRLDEEEYNKLWHQVTALGFDVITTPQSFCLASSFALHYPLLGELSPRAVICNNLTDEIELNQRISIEKLKFPVFVRSEIESAAKYVGIEGCIMREPTKSDIERVLGNLKQHVKGFKSIIVKELLPIATERNGTRLEFRAVGARGRLISFDHDSCSSSLPAPQTFGLEASASRAFGALQDGGLSGAVFLDLAIVEGGRPIVVECKDFSHGTIAHCDRIADALTRWH